MISHASSSIAAFYHSKCHVAFPTLKLSSYCPTTWPATRQNAFPGTVYDNADHALGPFGDNIELDYRVYEVGVENLIRVLTDRLSEDVKYQWGKDWVVMREALRWFTWGGIGGLERSISDEHRVAPGLREWEDKQTCKNFVQQWAVQIDEAKSSPAQPRLNPRMWSQKVMGTWALIDVPLCGVVRHSWSLPIRLHDRSQPSPRSCLPSKGNSRDEKVVRPMISSVVVGEGTCSVHARAEDTVMYIVNGLPRRHGCQLGLRLDSQQRTKGRRYIALCSQSHSSGGCHGDQLHLASVS